MAPPPRTGVPCGTRRRPSSLPHGVLTPRIPTRRALRARLSLARTSAEGMSVRLSAEAGAAVSGSLGRERARSRQRRMRSWSASSTSMASSLVSLPRLPRLPPLPRRLAELSVAHAEPGLPRPLASPTLPRPGARPRSSRPRLALAAVRPRPHRRRQQRRQHRKTIARSSRSTPTKSASFHHSLVTSRHPASSGGSK